MSETEVDCSSKQVLARNEGTLWLEMASDDALALGKATKLIADEISAFVASHKLGEYEGRSEGSGAFDVSFKVMDREAAAAPLRQHMHETYPGLRFSICDEYEGLFDLELGEPSLAERLERLEQMACMIFGDISEIRRELANMNVIPPVPDEEDEGEGDEDSTS